MDLALALALLLSLPAAAEQVKEPAQAAVDAYWEELRAKAQAEGFENMTGAQLFHADVAAKLDERQRTLFDVKARAYMAAALAKREAKTDAEREFASLFGPSRAPGGNGANQAMTANPALRELLWNAAMGGGPQLERLLAAFAEARKKDAALTLKDYLKGLQGDALNQVLMGDKVAEREEPKKDGEPRPGEPARKPPTRPGSAADVLASVGFDGAQAYGIAGDRHVYQDKAGNAIALSVASRRMPDGSLEDVLHVVNISNRAAPRGDTYSLRTDLDKLAAGVPVSIGGVSFTLKLSASGNDHQISMQGAKGPFVNAKGQPPMGLSELYGYRAARVFNYGRVVEIGGKEYYVAPETYSQLEGQPPNQKFTGYGQFTYWPKEQLDKLFAARGGRDEVDPQTFDFKALDLAGTQYGGLRGLRPDLAATVIRREGLQDVALQRASLGRDGQGRWWDAVLRDGQYVVERGSAPAPGAGTPGTPGQQVPPEGLSLADGRKYTPNGPLAQRLNAMLSGAAKGRVRFLENPDEPKREQRLLLVVDNRIDSIGFMPYPGASASGMPPDVTVSGEEVLDGRYLAVKTSKGSVWIDLENVTARGVVEKGVVGSFAPETGFAKVSDLRVLREALSLSGFSEADAKTVVDRFTAALDKRPGARFEVGGPAAGRSNPVSVVFTLPSGSTLVQNLWPNLGEPTAGAAQDAPAGSGFQLDRPLEGPAAVLHESFGDSIELQGGVKASYVLGDRARPRGAALYQSEAGNTYLAFTVTSPEEAAPRRITVRAFGGGFGPRPDTSFQFAHVELPAGVSPFDPNLKVKPKEGGKALVLVLGARELGTPLTWR